MDVIYCIMVGNIYQPQEEKYNNCVCIIVVTTLKMTTLVPETCQ